MIKPASQYNAPFEIEYDILKKLYEIGEGITIDNDLTTCNCDNSNLELVLQQIKTVIENKETTNTETIIEKPVIVEKPIIVETEHIVEKPVIHEIVVEKQTIIEKPIETVVYQEKIVDKPVEKIVYKEKIVEKPVEVIKEVVKEVVKEIHHNCNNTTHTETHIIYPCPKPKPQEIKPTEYNVRKINGSGTKVIASDAAWQRNKERLAQPYNTTDKYIHSNTCWNIMVKNPNYKPNNNKKVIRRNMAI